MKTPIVAVIVLACAGLSPLQGGKTGEAGGLKKRVTHAELAKRLAGATNPLESHERAKPLDPDSIARKERKKDLNSLLGRSHLLIHGGYWTLVPKGSILHVPEGYQSRLGSKPKGKLLAWKDFYARNRGWIYPQAVKMENARGEVPLSEEVSKNHRRLGRVVVAVLHNGPISLRAPAPKDPKDPEASKAPKTQ